LFIWFITILCTVEYIVSKPKDQLFIITLLLLIAIKLKAIDNQPAISKYNPILVNAIRILPKSIIVKDIISLIMN